MGSTPRATRRVSSAATMKGTTPKKISRITQRGCGPIAHLVQAAGRVAGQRADRWQHCGVRVCLPHLHRGCHG